MRPDCGSACGAVRRCVLHGAAGTPARAKYDDGAHGFRFRLTQTARDSLTPDGDTQPGPDRRWACNEGNCGAGLGPTATGR